MAATVTRRRVLPRVKNRIFLLLVIFSNTFGNCLLAMGMQRMPDFLGTPFSRYLLFLITNPWMLSGTALLALWLFSQLSMFTWADLSYVLPVTASGYMVTALLSKFVLDEHISALRWAGIVVITFGSMLVSQTPMRTKAEWRERDR
ncbi:MAG: hypothetical protein JOY54_13850 [Acidobacteriaceae bacterium]|nr:hypothetical protein [Acidobacteriaceae bacterium]